MRTVSENELVRKFNRKASRVFTSEFWRKRFTLAFWVRKYEFWRERRTGLDFLEVVEAEELGLDPNQAVESAPSGHKSLRAVFNRLPIGPADSILDVGSGKGNAMRVMLEFPFSQVDGVEIAPQIVQISKSNFEKLKIPTERYKIFQMDAVHFKDLDPYNHFYFYNPFSSEIMDGVVQNIVASIRHMPRTVLLIYNNPKYEHTILSKGIFTRIASYPGEWQHRICLYTNLDG
jgi:SAM-dependent methyltransferase